MTAYVVVGVAVVGVLGFFAWRNNKGGGSESPSPILQSAKVKIDYGSFRGLDEHHKNKPVVRFYKSGAEYQRVAPITLVWFEREIDVRRKRMKLIKKIKIYNNPKDSHKGGIDDANAVYYNPSSNTSLQGFHGKAVFMLPRAAGPGCADMGVDKKGQKSMCCYIQYEE